MNDTPIKRPADDDSLEAQRERLDAIAALEAEMDRLRAEQNRLEVARIESEVALRAVPRGPGGLSAEQAGPLAEALERVQGLRARMGTGAQDHLADADAGELDRLQRGREALAEWLDAPNRGTSTRVKRIAELILGFATIAAVWAAFALHPVFLLLLVPVAGFVRFVSMSGEDTAWVRLGARRHFDATGLKGPAAWETAAVQARAAELNAAILAVEDALRRAEAAPQEGEAEAEDPEAEFSAARSLIEAEQALEVALAKAGLEEHDIDAPMREWLDQVLTRRRADRDLQRANSRRRSLAREAEALRWRVFRFLSAHGEAPADGRAEHAILAEALDRVAAREGAPPG